MKAQTIPYGRQTITEEDIAAVVQTLQSDFLTQGPKVPEFEKNFADYVGAKYAVACSNGTAALHLSAIALNVNAQKKVLSTPITFAASTNGILYCNGKVDFVDIDAVSFTIDLNKLEDKLKTAHYSGIVPVDFAGMPVDMENIRSLADKYNCWIIEDACHAPGAFFYDSNNKKQYCGNGVYADLTVFSFHPVKHIACGEGGMITTNNEKLYQKLSALRSHGIVREASLMQENHGGWYYEMQDLGYNYRMTEILASLGISQLKKIDKNLVRRHEIAKKYNEALHNIGDIELPYIPDKNFHALHLYVIKTNRRLELFNYLRENNIFAQVHYIPVHTLPYYQKLGFKKGDFPIAENYYEKCLSIPLYHGLSEENQAYVIDKIKAFFAT